MDEREKLRMWLTGQVGKLFRYRSFRDVLPPLTADGASPFVVGLLDDTMKTITTMVDQMGGDVHLVIPDIPQSGEPTRVRILRMTADRDERHPLELDEHECPVDESSTLAMLLELLHVGGEITCQVYDHETMVRFITDGVQPVPA